MMGSTMAASWSHAFVKPYPGWAPLSYLDVRNVWPGLFLTYRSMAARQDATAPEQAAYILGNRNKSRHLKLRSATLPIP
eukprot:jgi/Botrbrau1/18557/Bobra.0367s0008.1